MMSNRETFSILADAIDSALTIDRSTMETPMEFSLDESMSKVDPWDLTLVIDGKKLAVRPITNEDLVLFKSLPTKSVDEQMEYMRGLFTDREAAGQISVEKLGYAVIAILSYFKEKFSKNSNVVADQVATAMKRSTSGK